MAHRVRLFLTGLAIVIGVSLVAGTFVLTDTARASLRSIFGQSSPRVAAAVEGPARFGAQGLTSHLSVPASLADRVAGVRGVAAVQGLASGYAQPIARDGSLIGGKAGAPTIGLSVGSVPSLEALQLREGRLPAADTEMVVDQATFESQGWRLGERIRVASSQPVQAFKLVGVVTYGSAQDLAGATLSGFDLATAQRLFGLEGRYSVIYVASSPGLSAGALAKRLSRSLGPPFEVLTGKELQAQLLNGVETPFSFLTDLLLVLGGVSLFVGSFMIFNTFSITLAQRSRELGLLRCLGASRRQVVTSVLGEAAAIGLLASLAGLGLGVTVAIGLEALLGVIGVDLPSTSPQLSARTVAASLGGGVGITLLASVLPATRAARVPPVAALADNPAGEVHASARRRAAVGLPLTLAGVAILMAGLFVQSAGQALTVGAGAVALFLGLAVLSPLVARPIAGALGWPLVRARGVEARLAQKNAVRNPRRSASTASALMVGVALVSFIAVIASSARSSATAQLEESLRADYVLGPRQPGAPQPLSDQLAARLTGLPQLRRVSPVTYVSFLIRGRAHSGLAVDPGSYPSVVNLGRIAGTLHDLGASGLAVSSQNAKRDHIRLGEKLRVVFAGHGAHEMRVRATYSSGDNFGGFLLPRSDLPLYFDDQRPTEIFVEVRPGTSASSARAAIDRVTAAFPNVKVDDQASVKGDAQQGVDQIMSVIGVLLLLAIVLALLGVTNTLALSVLERTRELGLLRAIGMAPAQVRAAVRWESLIISVLGALPGAGVGVALAWAMQRSLESQGLTVLDVPVARLALYVVVAGVAGLAAGMPPARRAARIDVLSAITAE